MLQEGQAKQPAGDPGGLKHPFPMPLNLSLPAEGDLGCMWMGTAQEERSEGETGNKTRSGEDGERRCVLEDLSRSVGRNFGAKNEC